MKAVAFPFGCKVRMCRRCDGSFSSDMMEASEAMELAAQLVESAAIALQAEERMLHVRRELVATGPDGVRVYREGKT